VSLVYIILRTPVAENLHYVDIAVNVHCGGTCSMFLLLYGTTRLVTQRQRTLVRSASVRTYRDEKPLKCTFMLSDFMYNFLLFYFAFVLLIVITLCPFARAVVSASLPDLPCPLLSLQCFCCIGSSTNEHDNDDDADVLNNHRIFYSPQSIRGW